MNFLMTVLYVWGLAGWVLGVCTWRSWYKVLGVVGFIITLFGLVNLLISGS